MLLGFYDRPSKWPQIAKILWPCLNASVYTPHRLSIHMVRTRSSTATLSIRRTRHRRKSVSNYLYAGAVVATFDVIACNLVIPWIQTISNASTVLLYGIYVNEYTRITGLFLIFFNRNTSSKLKNILIFSVYIYFLGYILYNICKSNYWNR